MSVSHNSTGQVQLDGLLQVCRTGDDIDDMLLKEMLSLFIQENDRRLDAARDAAASGNHGELRQAAHAVKGSAALLGAERLRALAAALEDDALGGGAADAVGATAELRREYAAVVATLHAMYPDLASA